MKVVELPIADLASVAERLRDLASAIEEGHFGDAHNVAWVIDCGNGQLEGLGPIIAQMPMFGGTLYYFKDRILFDGTEEDYRRLVDTQSSGGTV